MDRVLLGKKSENSDEDGHRASIIFYTPSPEISIPGLFSEPAGAAGTILLTETDTTKFQVGDLIIFPPIAAGDQYLPQERRVTIVRSIGYGEGSVSAGSYVQITVDGLNIEGGALLLADRKDDVVSYINSVGGIENRSETIRQQKETYGLWVSKPSSNVLDPNYAHGGNVSFDSSD